MKKKYKWILLIIIVLISAAGFVSYLIAPLSVTGIHIRPGTYRDMIEEKGTLTAQRKWNLFAPQSLIVKEIYKKEGDSVKKGDLLIKLDDGLLSKQLIANKNSIQLQILALKGELSSTGAQKEQNSKDMIAQTIKGITSQILTQTKQLESAQNHYENMKILYEDDYISKTELEQAELEVVKLENSIAELNATAQLQNTKMETTRAHYASLENTLRNQISTLERLSALGETDMQSAQLSYLAEQTSLYAPSDGKVLAVNVQTGEMADPQIPVTTVYVEGSVGAEVFLLASDATQVFPGMEAQIVVDGKQKQTLSALVTAVSPNSKEILSELGLLESRVKVTLTVNEETNIIIGQRADVQFVLAAKENAIAVPKASVFEYESGFAVMTQVNGKAHLTVIEKEFETDTMVVIKSGLAEGDVVLLNPTQEGLKEGVSISVALQ